MVVKQNQPDLCWEVAQLFADPTLVAATGTRTVTFDKGHRRLEVRRLWTSTALVGYSDWPGLAQALCLEREVTRLSTGEVRRERAYAVTSLTPAQADAAALLRLWRGHWGIGNRLHWLREVGLAEDRSPARLGSVPQGLAATRNIVLGLLRAHGHPAIAATCRTLARNPTATPALIGL